jgi:hypothetical protein
MQTVDMATITLSALLITGFIAPFVIYDKTYRKSKN